MKILVTGGTVFVSKYIAEYFTRKGAEVYALNRNTRPQVAGVTLIECDRRAPKRIHMHFDFVIDVNAYTAEDIDKLSDCIDGCDGYLMISSSAVYPETLPQPFKVGDMCGPNRFWGKYGTDKAAAENALLKRLPKAYILRPAYIYGEYNNIYREAFVFDCADRDYPFYLPSDGKLPLQFFYVGDLCRLIEVIIEKRPAQNIYNVGNGSTVTAEEWVRLCYAVAGKVPTIEYVGCDTETRNYFPFHNYAYRLDVAMQNLLLPDLLPLETGLKRAYGWYREHKGEVNRKNYYEFILNNLI